MSYRAIAASAWKIVAVYNLNLDLNAGKSHEKATWIMEILIKGYKFEKTAKHSI